MSEFFNFNQEDAVFNNLMSDDMQSDINVNNNLEANLETDLAQQPIDPPGKPSSFAKAIEQSNEKLFNSLAQPEPAELKGSAIKTVSPESIEKFQAQEWYDPLNFNPLAYDTNMQKAIEKETWGTALSKGFDQFFYNAGNTFTGWFSDYGKMFDAVANFDWDALKPTESELMTQYYEDQKKMNENYVFVPQEDEDGIFNKKFFAEFLGNVGYTYGTISALGLELAADFLITGLSGGSGSVSFGATAARALSKIGIKKAAKEGVEAAAKASLFRRTMAGYELADKSTDAIAPIVRATTQAEIAAAYRIPSNVAKETFNSYLNLFSNNLLNISKSKTAYEMAGNIMKGLPLLGTGLRYGENIAEAARAGAGLAELTGMGLKGLRRVSQELNMAISEASFESVSSYGDTLDGLVKDYQNKNNGQLPDVETFNEMRDYAVKASSSNYDTNTAILLASNKLQFGNLFNKFVPANKALLSLQDAMVDRTVAQVAKRGAFKLYDKSGLFGTYGIIGKVASDFGKKEAAKMIGKSMFRNFVQFEVVEGAQEIVQEASASAWKNYYTNQFNKNTEYTLSDAFGEGFKEQYSKQGLKTFLMGALTGTLVKGPSKVLNNLATKTQEAYYNNKYGKDGVDNPIVQHRENLKKDIDAINAVFAKGGPGSFSSKMFNFNTQLNSTNEMDESASKGMQYEFENGKDNALLSATLSAYRTNTSKGFINAIREMGINMTNEEFKSEFGIDLADTKYSTPAEFSNNVADKMQKYSDTIEAIRTNAKNKFVDPYDYEDKTVDRNIAIYTRKAQEEAVYVLAMNAIKADMTAERLAQLGNDLRNIPGLKNSSDYAMRVLTDPKTLGGELRLLQTRLAQLESADTTGFTPELIQENKKQIKEIQEEIKLLTEWAGLWKGRAEVTGKATDTGIVFVGKEINKKQRVKDANGKTIWEPTVTYNPKDKKVAELFRKIVNLKNSQANIDTLLSQVDLNEGFEKIADYIQLDRDTKDYLDAVEVLSEPSRFMEIIKYSQEGLFKYNLENAIGELVKSYGTFATNLASSITKDQQEAFSIAQTIFNTIHDKVTNSNEYNSLVAIITDPNSNLDNYKESYTLLQKLENIVSLETYKFIKEYMPEEYKNDVTTEELDEALTGNLSDFRELSIAEKILNNEQLTENEQKIYDDPKLKEVIDDLVQDLKSTGYESSTELIENEDGTVNIVDKRTGEIINEQPLSQEEAESLKEQIDATENQDPVSVAASEELNQSQKAPVNLDEEFATASQGVEEDYTQSNDEILKQFLNYSDSEKIKFLEQVRSFKPEYKALRQALGKGQISKEQYEQQVDVINQNTFILGAEDLTLKSLLSKFKLENTNNDTQVGTAPTTPAVTAQEIKAQPTATPAPTASISDTEAEKQKITPYEFKELVRLAKFFLENPKEPTVAGSVVTKYPNLFKEVTAIERRRQEEINKPLEAVKNAKTKEDLIKASEEWIGVNPYDDGAVSMGVRSLLMTPGSFEKGKQAFIEENKKIAEIRDKQINAKYNEELTALEGKSTAPVSDKKADIERRKKISLQGIEEGAKVGSEEATYYGPNWDPSDMTNIVENITTVYGKTKQELIDRIEKLYNAELDALKGKSTTTVSEETRKADIINKLFEKNILTPLNNGNTWMLDGDGRIFVVANINGNKVLFYTSSEGTSGKNKGSWYPVIGISNFGYIIKGSLDAREDKYNLNEGYGIKEIKDFQNFLNENLNNVQGRPKIELENIFGEKVETNVGWKLNKEFDLDFLTNTTTEKGAKYQVLPKKNDLGLSREEAIDIWLKRFKLKETKRNISAELTALEGKSTAAVSDKKADIKRRRQEILDNYKNKIKKENPELSNNSIKYKVYEVEQFLNAIENDVFLIRDVKEIAKELFGTELKISDAGTLLFANNDKDIPLGPNIIKSKLKDALSSSQFTLEYKQKGKIGLGDKLTKEQVDILDKAINAKYDEELDALEETQPEKQPEEEVKPQSISMVVANTPYEIINNEVFYNGQPIGLDLKLSVDVSTMSPFDVIKLHLKQKEKEAKSKKTVLSKQLKDLIKLQEEINAESVDPVAEEVVEENITPQQDTEIDEAREVVIERVIEEELDDETRSLIAEEENVSEDQVDRIIADAVADVVDNNKKGLFDKLGDSAKKFVKKILIIISALTISGFALYSGPGQSLVKNIFLETQEVVTPDEEITFTTSSFNVTPLEGCSAYVNNQVRAVIGKKGQEAINLFGHAWTSSYNMVSTGRGKFIFNIFDNYKKPANIKTSSQINAEIKKLVNKAGTITESQLQEGDIVSMYYENSLASEEAWTNGKGTYITHVGIVKRNSDGKLVVEDNIHGIIRNYTVEDLNASKIESRAGGKIRIAAVARPDYKLANKKIKPYAPAKELSTSNTPIKKNKPLQAAGLFGIGLLLRRKKDEGQDISTELQNEIDKLKLEIDNVNTTVKDIKNNLKSLSDAIYYYEQNFKPVVPKPAALTPKQLALQESLIREMVKPNGKLITDFTSEEQDLINQADVSLKQKLQKEEQAAYDAKQKVQDDYKPFNNVSEEDLDDNISELFATPDKIDNTKRNREFSKKYLKTEEESLIIPFITDVLQALNDYNKKNKTELETVEDFVKFSKTKAIAEDIKNNLLATQATSTEDVKQVLDDSELGDNFSELLGEDVVEVTEPTSTEVDSNNKETLNTNFINSLVKDFQESKDKNSKNNAKFVEKDSIQSLLNDINDITNCL